MELLFSVSSCLKKLRVDGWPQYGKPLCSISTRNVVAFTSSILLNTKVSFRELPEWGGGHVYVVDLDQPWKALRILGNDEYITVLEWDASGSRLLLADVTGKCQCWGMKDFLLNSWTLLGTVEINMEQILVLRWFHKGSKIALERESRDNTKYSDRFKRVPFQPTVAQYGGCALDGWVAVTATGLISVTLLNPQGQKLTLEENLAATRSRIAVCDVAYCNNGELMVAASDGCVSSAVSCFNLSIKSQPDGSFSLTCLPIASFFLNAYTSNFESCPYSTLSHLAFVWKEGTNSIIACAAGSACSSVEFWELKEHVIPINKVFLTSGGATELRKMKWKYVDSVMHTAEVTALVASHLSPSDSELIPHYTSIVAYKDYSVKLLYRSNVSQMAAVTMENIVRLANDSGLSPSTTAGELTCLRQSTTGYMLVGIDSYSQLFVYRLSTSRDTYFQTGTMIAINLIVNLLEYCMLNGYDWFDVLLCIRPNYTDNICEWITENFNKQPTSVQQMYCNKFLALKASLYRRIPHGQGRAGDCIARILLNSVATSFQSVLRPSALVSQEKGPAEKLSSLIRNNANEADLSNMLSLVKASDTKARDYVVDPSILLSAQQLIQWVADFTLYLLAVLPTYRFQKMDIPGCGLLKDANALNTLRELIVLIRLWGLINPNSLPNFSATSDNLDCLPLLFKLISKALLCCSSEPDEALLDECGLLPSQVLIPVVDLGISAKGLSSANLTANQQPFHFEYDVSPRQLGKTKPEPYEFTNQTNGQKQDAVRKVFLGVVPSVPVKQCTRCNSMAALGIGTRSPVMKAWDQHWSRSCLCGGHWRTMLGKET